MTDSCGHKNERNFQFLVKHINFSFGL